MAQYSATVQFLVYAFEADNEAEANSKMNDLIDQLSSVDTNSTWDDVDWKLQEEN